MESKLDSAQHGAGVGRAGAGSIDWGSSDHRRVQSVLARQLSFTLGRILEGQMKYEMDHIVLNVTDEERMISFYSEVLQLRTERLEEFRSGNVPFPSLRITKNTIVDLFPKKMWGISTESGKGRTNLNHLCFALRKREWDELRDRLENANVPIITGPVPRWGARGHGISIYFHDPEGNAVEARYYGIGDVNNGGRLKP
jgi:catechol 2,3-dioxygenase-like lactoylglutathione lyase family enzyme